MLGREVKYQRGGGYELSLRELSDTLNLNSRVLFYPAVPIEKLRYYIGAVEACVSIPLPVSQNHVMALPNKFSEAVQGGTPVIVSAFPEMGRLVDMYKIGIKVNPEDPSSIASAIMRLKDDQEAYSAYKRNTLHAKKELCWEKESSELKKAYKTVLRMPLL